MYFIDHHDDLKFWEISLTASNTILDSYQPIPLSTTSISFVVLKSWCVCSSLTMPKYDWVPKRWYGRMMYYNGSHYSLPLSNLTTPLYMEQLKGLNFPGSQNTQFCRLVVNRSRHLLKPVRICLIADNYKVHLHSSLHPNLELHHSRWILLARVFVKFNFS